MSAPTPGSAVRIAVRLVLRAGWAPAAVLLLHVVLAEGLKLYGPYPHLDVFTHALGGIAMAYFLSRCFAAIPETAIPRGGSRAALEGLFAVSLTATAAVFWELYEFTCDRVFHTRKQGGNSDTMGDLAVGIAGSLLYVVVASRLRRLGRIEPVVSTRS